MAGTTMKNLNGNIMVGQTFLSDRRKTFLSDRRKTFLSDRRKTFLSDRRKTFLSDNNNMTVLVFDRQKCLSHQLKADSFAAIVKAGVECFKQ
jgi:hypothetical protein